MRNIPILAAVSCLLVPLTATAQSLVGVWSIEEAQVEGGDNPGTFTGRPGMHIFTDEHFSQVVSRGGPTGNGPRPKLSEDFTDSERFAAYSRFYASSGTYTLVGSTLTRRVFVSENPNNIDTTPTSEVRFEGDDVVWLTFNPNRGGRSLSDITVTQKLVRVE